MTHKKYFLIVFAIVLLVAGIVHLFFSLYIRPRSSHDWSAWRFDAGRTASSPQILPKKLNPQWVREYPKLEQAWEDPLNQDLMQFDRAYEPVVQGRTIFIGSNASDRVIALDTRTGAEKWVFYADGPVRFAPVASKGKVYFVSDDGYLYCLDANQGNLVWKFRGGPSERKILGNDRLISTWPARGGPVLKDGIIYFAAGIWPFMGISIYALNAKTGDVVWANDSTGSIYMKQPHNSPSYAGVAPQGNLVISGDKLLIPCGRSVPACFDRKTGELKYYHLSQYNKTGGAFVCALGNFFVNYHRDFVTSIYELSEGHIARAGFGKIPVMTEEALFCMGDGVTAHDFGNLRQVEYEKEVKDKETQETKIVKEKKWVLDKLWELDVDASGDLIKAGNRLYAGGKNIVSAIDVEKHKVTWSADIDGTAARIIAADKRLFVVTLEGKIYAFGEEEIKPETFAYKAANDPIAQDASQKAETILKTAGIKEGYCLAYGLKDGDMVNALVRNSELRVIAVDADAVKVDRLRRRFDAEGLYGKRLSVLTGDPVSFEAPPYLSSLTVFEDMETVGSKRDATFFRKIYHSLRPYGGSACLTLGEDEFSALKKQVQDGDLPGAEVRQSDGLTLLIRSGPLPGSDDWTHQYGDVANTVKSDDELVKLPLGILWFGGSSNMDVLPRHGHGPPEQVIGGRLFIQGIGLISARDVYTGRVLWRKELPDLDTFEVYYNETYKDTPLSPAYNQIHIPGANARGTNFVATPDRIYIVLKSSCLVLDPATGEILDEIKLPPDPDTGQPPEWGYLGVYRSYIIAGAGFASYKDFIDLDPKITDKQKPFYNYDITSSKKLIVMDRYTGKVIWSRKSKLGFRHNGICAGGGKVFCMDVLPSLVSDTMERRGKEYSAAKPSITALDMGKGSVVWSTGKNIFGTWLSYSEEYDVLLQSGRRSRDMIAGEPNKGMEAYRGKDGKSLWTSDVSYGGPCMLHGDKIITDQYAYSLLNGEQKTRVDPLTGVEEPWEFKRNYGCNYVVASENLLTFRSAAAGFFDLVSDGGTGNFGGFKSGCTSNLIAADGVLNAPDYTRTCSCSYQNQASLALVHAPEVEIWTDYFGKIGDGAIRNVGINFGAPGDRRADDGTLWLEYPIVGGPSPEISVSVEPESYERFIHHSSQIQGDGLKWVAASGIKGLSSVKIKLFRKPEAEDKEEKPAEEIIEKRPYTVRLYFSEPEDMEPEQRMFDVTIQGQEVLRNFDIVREAGGANRLVVKEFKGIQIREDLTVDFAPSNNQHQNFPVICGIEVMAEGW